MRFSAWNSKVAGKYGRHASGGEKYVARQRRRGERERGIVGANDGQADDGG